MTLLIMIKVIRKQDKTTTQLRYYEVAQLMRSLNNKKPTRLPVKILTYFEPIHSDQMCRTLGLGLTETTMHSVYPFLATLYLQFQFHNQFL